MSLSREFKVGLFIVCTAFIIIVSLLYLAYEKGFFEKVYTFTLSSKSGDGFTEGMPVVFSGFNIGTVHALEINDNAIVLIRIKIPERHVKWVKIDSTFILYRPLIGVSRIIVTTDNLSSPQLPENKIPEVEIVNDINDVITKVPPLIDKITLIAANLETLSKTLADPKGDFKQITSNLANVLQKVDKIADKTDAQLYGKDGTLPQLNTILKDIIGKLEKLNTTVDNINKISLEASDGMKDFRNLRSDIDDTVNSLDDVVNKLDDFLSAKKEPEFKLP